MELTIRTPADIQERYSSRNHHCQEVRPSFDMVIIKSITSSSSKTFNREEIFRLM